jgi:hypothetical protein
MPGYLEQEDPLSGSTTTLSIIPKSITQSALPPSSEGHREKNSTGWTAAYVAAEACLGCRTRSASTAIIINAMLAMAILRRRVFPTTSRIAKKKNFRNCAELSIPQAHGANLTLIWSPSETLSFVSSGVYEYAPNTF